MQSNQIGSGFGASISAIMKGFHGSYRLGKPYQISKSWSKMRWLYATSNQPPWCPTTDINCNILPVSNWKPTYQKSHKSRPGKVYREKPSYRWVMKSLIRFRHEVRWNIQNSMDQLMAKRLSLLKLKGANCTAIHGRRGD